MAQDLDPQQITQYKIICLLDVIEHLEVEPARALMRLLLSSMANDAYLFVSTPLWFYPQHQMQPGDLEEHKIAGSVATMMSLLPVMFSFNEPLIGGFVYEKKSLEYVELFQPVTDKNFTREMGLNILRCIGLEYQPGRVFRAR